MPGIPDGKKIFFGEEGFAGAGSIKRSARRWKKKLSDPVL
jgi:hypothetical protein